MIISNQEVSIKEPRRHLSLLLDFDGVLNNDLFLRQQRNHGGHKLFDPKNMMALNLLCLKLKPNSIALCTSWRLKYSQAELREILGKEGFHNTQLVKGKTEELNSLEAAERRPQEVRDYILAHPKSIVVVLDDEFKESYLTAETSNARVIPISSHKGLSLKGVQEFLRLWAKEQL